MGDSLGTWADIMSIVSGGILAGAAVFAFVLQRSNYLKRTYSRLAIREVALQKIGRSQLESYDTDASLAVLVQNNSTETLSVTADGYLTLRYAVIGEWGRTVSKSTSIWYVEPEDSATIPIRFAIGPPPEGFQLQASDDYWVDLNVRYSPPRDLFMFLISPWTGGKRRFTRRVSVNFGPMHRELQKEVDELAPDHLDWRTLIGKPLPYRSYRKRGWRRLPVLRNLRRPW